MTCALSRAIARLARQLSWPEVAELIPVQHRRLSSVLKLNLPVVRAYYLKEEFQAFPLPA